MPRSLELPSIARHILFRFEVERSKNKAAEERARREEEGRRAKVYVPVDRPLRAPAVALL